MVMHGVVRHSQNRRDSGATPEGAAAAAVSNLAGSIHPGEPDSWAVDVWMQAPFHASDVGHREFARFRDDPRGTPRSQREAGPASRKHQEGWGRPPNGSELVT